MCWKRLVIMDYHQKSFHSRIAKEVSNIKYYMCIFIFLLLLTYFICQYNNLPLIIWLDCDNDDECDEGLTCMQRYNNEVVEGCIGTIRDSIDVCILDASTTSTQSRDDKIYPTYAPSIWPSYSPTLEMKQATVQNYTGSLLSKDPDTGRLIYAKYKNQGQDNAVNTVPDYSSAGYKGGGIPIPFITTTGETYNLQLIKFQPCQ